MLVQVCPKAGSSQTCQHSADPLCVLSLARQQKVEYGEGDQIDRECRNEPRLAQSKASNNSEAAASSVPLAIM